MNQRIWRLIWTTTLLVVLFGGLATVAPNAEATVRARTKGLDVGITKVCRRLGSPPAFFVTVTNLGVVPAEEVEVSAFVVSMGVEYSDGATRQLSVSPLEPGDSATVYFTNREVPHYREGVVFQFTTRVVGERDARPEDNARTFVHLNDISHCPVDR